MEQFTRYIPYCEVECFDFSGKSIRKFHSNEGPKYQAYMDREQIGLSEVKITNSLDVTKVNISFEVGDKISKETMDNITNLRNNWRIRFGWGAGSTLENNRRTINNLKMTPSLGLEYDPTYRIYKMNIELIPMYNLALSEIPIFLLRNFIDEMKEAYKNKDKAESRYTKQFSLTKPKIYSIWQVIKDVIEESKQIIENKSDLMLEEQTVSVVEKEEKNWISRNIGKLLRSNFIASVASKVTRVPRGAMQEVLNISAEKMIYSERKLKINISDTFEELSSSDLPTLNDFRLILTKSTSEEVNELKNAFENDIIKSWSSIEKLFDINNINMNVLQFINGLLNEHAFQMASSLGILSDGGRILLMVVNMDSFSLKWETAFEREFANRNGKLVTQQEKTNPYFFEENSAKNIFNLQSRFNLVKSISANVAGGETNLFTAQLEQKIIDGDEKLVEDNSPLSRNIESYSEFIATKSKMITIETILLPIIKSWDDLNIVFLSEIDTSSEKYFSGRYKIIELTHSIAPGDASTSLEMQQIINNIQPAADEVVEKIIESTDEEIQKIKEIEMRERGKRKMEINELQRRFEGRSRLF